MKKHQQSMLQGPIFPSIVAYTVPIILTSLLQLLFNAADLVVVGRFCGSQSVAAVGATSSITNLVVNLFIGLSVGAGVSMAHAIGSRDEKAMHRTVHTALPMAVISGVILTIVGISLAETFLTWMDTPPEVLPLSTLYMQVYFAGMTFNMVYNFSAALLRAAGDTKSPLIFLTIAGVINVVLNVIFVTLFQMNVAGVALATTISQGVSAVLVVIALMRRTDASRLYLKKLRFYKRQLLQIVAKGLPAGIQSSLFSISNVVIQSSINTFGDVFLSGSSAASNIEGFVYACMNAFMQTALNFTGQNAGAGQYARIKKIAGICMVSVTVVGITLGALVYVFSPYLLAIYITDSPQSIVYGVERLAFLVLPYFLLGLHEVASGTLRGLGASVSPMVVSVLGVCGFRILWVETVFQIPQFHTPDWLFVSYPISWVLTFVTELILLVFVYRKFAAKCRKTEVAGIGME
ncbi:MAG: MATE family efflux transporter [Ruminococcaceae bacterium]|nr:MATE family efflux transporter [Oscillospiraceae bacterium]